MSSALAWWTPRRTRSEKTVCDHARPRLQPCQPHGFVAHGAASNQIGKTYPYLSVLRPESRALLEGLKRQLDPGGALNPGALELSAG